MTDYSLLSDNELVDLCKKGEAQAFSVLIGRYTGVAFYFASQYCTHLIEKEDLSQEGMLGFISAVYSFDKTAEASFSTFANRCIKNRIISAVRPFGSKKQIPSQLILPLEEQLDSPSDEISPEDAFISAEETRRIYNAVDVLLTNKERDIFLKFLSGMSYEQIAKENDCTTKSVDGTLQRVRKKLREFLS